MSSFHLTPVRAAVLSGLYVALWCGVVFLLTDEPIVAQSGWVVFYLIGLAWAVYGLERAARRIERRVAGAGGHARPQISVGNEVADGRRGGWNPLDPAARYYGPGPGLLVFFVLGLIGAASKMPDGHYGGLDFTAPLLDFCAIFRPIGDIALVLATAGLATAVARSNGVRQSLSMVAAYSILFALVYFLAHMEARADGEIEAELPAGGGNDSIKPATVKVQKVVRKKYVINPYSAIVFAAPPPIDQIELKLTVETANQYKAGQGPGGLGKGAGKGGGFGSGTGNGKYELIRLQHSDKSWNKNFGVGGDRNLLAELKVREPATKVSEEDRAIDYTTLARASTTKAFPLIYIGGAHTFAPTEAERRILHDYLIDKHGMVLGDNLGGHGFHNAFTAEMTRITGVNPVPIPRDDYIHQRPYELPQLPIVVAHGGTTALGWKVDGRWVAYYHPGALSDAWRDDHAGIKKAIWEQCYQLGINILYYAYSEQDKWRESQKGTP